MFKIKKAQKQIKKANIDKPRFYKEMIMNVDNPKLNTYWFDNRGQIPNFNSWGELYIFLKNETYGFHQNLK